MMVTNSVNGDTLAYSKVDAVDVTAAKSTSTKRLSHITGREKKEME